jgi:ferredoxin
MTVERGPENVGTVEVASGRTPLEAGLDGDLPPAYSCTVGTRGACRVKLLRGAVDMTRPNCLTPRSRLAA